MDTVELACHLDRARLEGLETSRLSQMQPGMTLGQAYQVQEEGIRFRESQGEKRVGLKMGFTSEAKRQQMGLGSPIYGWLTDRMQVPSNGEIPWQGSIHPKIEPEIAFRISRELRGRVTRQEALAACDGVCAAMEILDSRYMGFKYFSLEDVVADNASSSRFVLGEWQDPRSVDVGELEMEMWINGELSQKALSSAISGHPADSLVQLCSLLAECKLSLPAGMIVLAGAATAAVALEAGMRVRTVVRGLGEVTARVSG